MKKYISFALVMVLTVLSFGQLAFAEETTNSATETRPTPMTAELKEKMAAQREAIRKEIDAKKDALKTEREAFKTTVAEKRDAFKADIEAKREVFKAELESKKKEFQALIQSERSAFKIKLEAERADFKANIKEKRGEFRGNAKQILSERFEAAVKNLTNSQTRVGAAIEKLKAAGKDTVQAEVYLADSKTKLKDAQAKLAEVRALVPATDDKVTVENWEKIKQGANDVKNLLKESHKSLVEAVRVLKGLGKSEKPEAENKESDDSAESSQ